MTQEVTPQNPTPPGLAFLFGAQYYRAPTPSPECWEADLSRMRALGFNAVKFWAQWRWSHREADPDRFFWEDLDRLMDLAAKNGLGVTLNTIFDVAPLWLYRRHPDARQIDAAGTVVEPYIVGHRQIGGHPGPCYNHPQARAHRERFHFCESGITLRFNADGTGTAAFTAFGTRSEVRGRWKREGDRLTLTGTHFADDENGNGSFESGEVSALDEPQIQTLEIEELTSESLVVEDLDDTGSDEIHTTFERQ